MFFRFYCLLITNRIQTCFFILYLSIQLLQKMIRLSFCQLQITVTLFASLGFRFCTFLLRILFCEYFQFKKGCNNYVDFSGILINPTYVYRYISIVKGKNSKKCQTNALSVKTKLLSIFLHFFCVFYYQKLYQKNCVIVKI